MEYRWHLRKLVWYDQSEKWWTYITRGEGKNALIIASRVFDEFCEAVGWLLENLRILQKEAEGDDNDRRQD